MISTSVLASLRPLPVCARLRFTGRLVGGKATTYVRYASHKSTKAMKALKSMKKAEPRSAQQATAKQPAPKHKAAQQTPTKQAAKAQEPLNTNLFQYYALEQQLASKEGPTLLYHKNHWKLVLACYAMAGAGVWVMFNNYHVNIVKAVGVPTWVKATHYVGIAFVGIGVAAAFLYPARLIRSIHAIPYRRTPESPPSVKLQFRSNNILSFFLPALRTETTLDEVYLARKLTPSVQPVREEVPEGTLAKVVRAVSTAPSKMFYNLRSTITKERIVTVHIKSSFLRLGLRDDGWQWEKRGLDRLLGTEKKW